MQRKGEATGNFDKVPERLQEAGEELEEGGEALVEFREERSPPNEADRGADGSPSPSRL